MQRSTDRILTTHVGNLPDVPAFDDASEHYEQLLTEAVVGLIEHQEQIGLDVINEGEWTKEGTWLEYLEPRLGGFEPRAGRQTLYTQGPDRAEFADFYKWEDARAASLRGAAPKTQERDRRGRVNFACVAPVTYTGHEDLRRELEVCRRALDQAGTAREAFLTSTAPASLEPYRQNEYYSTQEEFLFAMANALKVEYDMIAAAGFIVQIDDAWTASMWERIGIGMGLSAYIDWAMIRVEALNHALADIPEEQIRYHLCWGSWHGPHKYDIPLRDLVSVLLNVKAGAYLIEGANPRHEHEYHVWEDVKLPEGKILVPGVVTHSTNIVEHPELVAERIERYVRILGPESVIAGCDCGFGHRTHPQIGWAKLEALVEGAALASARLLPV